MRIENDIKLDFDDVLIRPKRSTLGSRKDVVLERTYKFKHSTYPYRGIPIIAANMSTIGTFEMAKALRQYNLSTAIHKHYSIEDLNHYFNSSFNAPLFYSMGILEHDYEKLHAISKLINITHICVDVANGYTESFVHFLQKLRAEFPNMVIMAGNVVTGEMTQQLILNGVDIVKIGIGPGCLTADARVLMADGTYKNICDVKPGDRVITGDGHAAFVKRSFITGYRKVRSIKNTHFHTPLQLTSDHKCLVGDLTSVSTSTLHLETNTKLGENKISWKTADSIEKCAALLPLNIKFEIPSNFNFDIETYFRRKNYNISYKQRISSTYDTGYLFGMFLGNGNSYLDNNHSGRVTWYLGAHETDLIQKLQKVITNVISKEPIVKMNGSVAHIILHSKQWASFFDSFGKASNKVLPTKYLCSDREYLQGLHDGLVDSDGYVTDNTSKNLIELFGVINYLLHGSVPNVIPGGLQTSEHVQLNGYQIIKILKISDESEIEVPVYDLEIDDPSHSFIANNMIVHNSVCTTRKITGVGYPQLSAIIECADAAHGLGGLVCADGGCKTPGDVAKAFGAGADFVMLGGMLAGHDECGGELIRLENGEPTGMKFYGMSSATAMEKYAGGVAEYRASEGKEVIVPYRGSVENTIKEILGGLRSACTYTGARSLKDLSKCTTFVKVNRQLNTVFGQ